MPETKPLTPSEMVVLEKWRAVAASARAANIAELAAEADKNIALLEARPQT